MHTKPIKVVHRDALQAKLIMCAGPACRSAVHMDCMHWVNRDSYLPQGSRGLKVIAANPPACGLALTNIQS